MTSFSDCFGVLEYHHEVEVPLPPWPGWLPMCKICIHIQSTLLSWSDMKERNDWQDVPSIYCQVGTNTAGGFTLL
jgi:hypothetical protein